MGPGSGEDQAGDKVEPALRGGGLKLPGLKHWRLQRELSQEELARKVDLSAEYLSKVESGKRGCNPAAAQRLAAVLEVDLQDLRTKHDGAEEAQASFGSVRPRIPYRRVHQAYLKILLIRAVGSAYAAWGEREIEEHCEEGSWEEVIEAVRARKREIALLGEAMQAAGEEAGLPEEVRLFLGEVLESHPDLDIRLLANARRRERSEEGREELTRAMRELL